MAFFLKRTMAEFLFIFRQQIFGYIVITARYFFNLILINWIRSPGHFQILLFLLKRRYTSNLFLLVETDLEPLRQPLKDQYLLYSFSSSCSFRRVLSGSALSPVALSKGTTSAANLSIPLYVLLIPRHVLLPYCSSVSLCWVKGGVGRLPGRAIGKRFGALLNAELQKEKPLASRQRAQTLSKRRRSRRKFDNFQWQHQEFSHEPRTFSLTHRGAIDICVYIYDHMDTCFRYFSTELAQKPKVELGKVYRLKKRF